MDLVDANLGPEGKVEVDVVDGKIVLKLEHVHASGKLSLIAEENLLYFLAKLAEKVPALKGFLP